MQGGAEIGFDDLGGVERPAAALRQQRIKRDEPFAVALVLLVPQDGVDQAFF